MPAELDNDRTFLTDDGMLGEPSWPMDPALAPMLAESLRLLGELLPQGFSFRATCPGSNVGQERVLSSDALANLVLATESG